MSQAAFRRWRAFTIASAVALLGFVLVQSDKSKPDADGTPAWAKDIMEGMQDDLSEGADTPQRPTGSNKALTSLLSAKRKADLSADQLRLLDALPDPSMFSTPVRVAVVEARDPNGGLRLNDRWYEPKVARTECRITVDAPPVPTASVLYTPGNPNLVVPNSMSGQQLALASTPFSAELQLFDTSLQRDQMFAAYVEVTVNTSAYLKSCSGADTLVGTMSEVQAPPLGAARFSFVQKSEVMSQSGSFIAVKDRGLLRLGAGGVFGQPMDDTQLEAMTRETVKAVEQSHIAD